MAFVAGIEKQGAALTETGVVYEIALGEPVAGFLLRDLISATVMWKPHYLL